MAGHGRKPKSRHIEVQMAVVQTEDLETVQKMETKSFPSSDLEISSCKSLI